MKYHQNEWHQIIWIWFHFERNLIFFFGNKKTRFQSASYRLSINEYKTAQDKTRLKLEFIFRIESFFPTEMSMCLLLLLKDIVLFFTRKKVCLWFFFVAEIETTSKRFCAKSEGKRQKNRLYIELFIKIVTKTMSTLTSFVIEGVVDAFLLYNLSFETNRVR